MTIPRNTGAPLPILLLLPTQPKKWMQRPTRGRRGCYPRKEIRQPHPHTPPAVGEATSGRPQAPALTHRSHDYRLFRESTHPQGVFPFLHRAKAKIPTTLRSLCSFQNLTSPPQAQDHAPRSFSRMCMLCLLCNTAIKSLHDHHPSLGLSNPPEHKILTDGGTGHTRSAVIGGEPKGLKGGTPKRGAAIRQDGRSSEHARLYMPGVSPLLPGFSNRLSRIFTAPIKSPPGASDMLNKPSSWRSSSSSSSSFPHRPAPSTSRQTPRLSSRGKTPQVRCPRCGSEAVSR